MCVRFRSVPSCNHSVSTEGRSSRQAALSLVFNIKQCITMLCVKLNLKFCSVSFSSPAPFWVFSPSAAWPSSAVSAPSWQSAPVSPWQTSPRENGWLIDELPCGTEVDLKIFLLLSSRYSHIQTMLTACCSQFRPPSSHLHFMRNIYPGQYFKTPFIEQNSTNKKLFIRKTYFSFFGEEALEFHNVSLWMSQSFRWR